MIIRPYQKQDRKAVEAICMGTTSLETSLSKAMMDVFCDYYIDSQQTISLVLLNKDKVLGYIFCHPNFAQYQADIQHYLNEKKAGPMSFAVADGTINGLRGFGQEYPAHFHIQVDISAQNRGYGTTLIRTLEEELIQKGIPSLMLNVALDNSKAQAFYRKNGYIELEKNDCEIAMGKHLISRGRKQ